jgi:protein-tyrosine phosphatase
MRGPIPNSYRLHDGRLIAGEYPGDRDEEVARNKLSLLLDAGVTTFIDLTEGHELSPYDALVAETAKARGAPVTYIRLPIRDVSVPKSPSVMREILDTIDSALESGGTAYVHCWGGVGRTGTVVGCHLVRRGMTGEEALARVAELFKNMEKYSQRRRSPETDEQDTYVRTWAEAVPNANRADSTK